MSFPASERFFSVLECPFPVFWFFWAKWFCLGTSRDRGVCPRIFAPDLVPGQRDNGNPTLYPPRFLTVRRPWNLNKHWRRSAIYAAHNDFSNLYKQAHNICGQYLNFHLGICDLKAMQLLLIFLFLQLLWNDQMWEYFSWNQRGKLI